MERRTCIRCILTMPNPSGGMASHRVLAVNRGEREGSLKVELTLDDEALLTRFKRRVKFPGTPGGEEAAAAIADGYKRLFMPAIVRQVRHEMTRAAEEQAIAVFGMNLKQLLMQPPLTGKVVMGVDPGFRTGLQDCGGGSLGQSAGHVGGVHDLGTP